MDVVAWLAGLGLERYANQFSDNEIDEAILWTLTDEDLKTIGVAALGHRKKLLAAISNHNTTHSTLAQKPAPQDLLEGLRRQVTVLFADISGFTQISNRLDAEATHGLLNNYFKIVDGIVEEYGGHIDKHIGDSVMAVFGAPIAHSDDAQRAARAACDIHEAVVSIATGLDQNLQAHIGLASGQVVASGTGSDAHREYTITGDTVNLASRLLDLAKAGETYLSDPVHRSIAKIASCEQMDEIPIKGFDKPVHVWRLKSLIEAAVDSDNTAFVGRRNEINQLTAILDGCVETGIGQTIYIRGEAGIGKSRLVAELLQRAKKRGYTCHTGLALDFGVGKGQDAIRSIVRSLLEIHSNRGPDSSLVAAEKAAQLLSPESRVYLNDLLGIPQPAELGLIYDTMDNAARNTGKRQTLLSLIRAFAATGPVLVVVEDLHWASPLELSYLATLVGSIRDVRGVLVMTSRFDGDPITPAWRATAGNSPLFTMDLAPLGDAEALELAAGFFDATNRIAINCVERAGGNPLFLDQLLRAAQEIGKDEVPGSVQSLVQARVDRLEPQERLALQAASVIGQRFVQGTVRHLIDKPDYTFNRLLENSLIRSDGDNFLFSHALVRDAVYASLLTGRRKELHHQAAQWYSDKDTSLEAEHLDRADDPAASDAYLRAAQAEVSQFHFERAASLVKRGLELTIEPSKRYALTCVHGNILRELGDNARSIDAFREALRVSTDNAERMVAWIGMAEGMRMTDQLQDALNILETAQTVASQTNRIDQLAQIHFLRGNIYFPMGNIEGCLEQHNLALLRARESGSTEAEARALGGLGDAYYQRGRMITAHDHFRGCVELSRRHGFGRIEVANLSMIGFSLRYASRLPEALQVALDTIMAAAKVGHRRGELLGRVLAANVLTEMDEVEAAREHLDEAENLVSRSGARRFMTQVFLHRSMALRSQGHVEEARALCHRAMTVSRETGTAFQGPWICGELAICAPDEISRRQALDEGEGLLAAGAVSHNYLHFYACAMEAALNSENWSEVERYATALELYTALEPLPWSDFYIARGRALAQWRSGKRNNGAELENVRTEAERSKFRTATAAIETALMQ